MTTRVGNYEILAELGRGGMGVVYKARQEGLDRVVALKMVLVGAHASETDVRRFLIEARSVARLQHPNIVQVFEIGEDKGLPYFTLEYVDGPSLAVHMAGGPLPIREAARIAQTIATAMQYAHDLGVLHRDIKPANILLTSGGVPKIADFGLAKLVASGDEADARSVKTMTGVAVGTPSYMAPEQAFGDTRLITVAADQYQVGAVLYEMLTGRPPFLSTNAIDTLRQVISADPRSVREMRVQIPADLETICHKTLQKEPAQRYRSCADLASDLERFLKGEPILARRVPAVERLWRWGRRNPVVATLAATAAVLVIATAAIASWSAVTLAARNRDLAAESARAAESAQIARQQAHLAQQNERQAKEQSVRAEASAREALAQTTRADSSAQLARQQTGVAQRNLEEANRRSDRLKTYVQNVFTSLQQLNTAGSPQLRDYKKEMMSATLPLLEEIVTELPATGDAVPTRMRALFDLAQAAREQGDYAAADRSLTQLVRMARERVTLMAGSDASRFNLVLMLRERAVVRLRFNRNMDEHIALLQEAKALADEIVTLPRVSPQGLGRSTYIVSREQIATLNQDLGAAFLRIGNSARARGFFADAQQGYGALIAAINEGRAYAPDPAEPPSPVNPAPPENVRQQHLAGMKIALDRAGLAVGFALANMGESAAGLALLRQSANARRTAYESDTTNATNAVAYGSFLSLAAEEEAKAGDVDGALPQLERAALLLDRAVREDPKAVATRQSAAIAFYSLGSWREVKGDARSAETFARAVVLRRQVDATEPTDPLAQADLARAQAAVGDTIAALELAGRVERLSGLDNEVRMALAKGFARVAMRQRGAGRERTTERATALLNAALDNGYRDAFVLTHDPDLAELRSQARFTAVLSRIKN